MKYQAYKQNDQFLLFSMQSVQLQFFDSHIIHNHIYKTEKNDKSISYIRDHNFVTKKRNYHVSESKL